MFNNWHFTRLFRLVLGLIILIQGIILSDIPFILMGIGFSAMPMLNIGCCAGGSCKIKQT